MNGNNIKTRIKRDGRRRLLQTAQSDAAFCSNYAVRIEQERRKGISREHDPHAPGNKQQGTMRTIPCGSAVVGAWQPRCT
jgi:hypothetical protein